MLAAVTNQQNKLFTPILYYKISSNRLVVYRILHNIICFINIFCFKQLKVKWGCTKDVQKNLTDFILYSLDCISHYRQAKKVE